LKKEIKHDCPDGMVFSNKAGKCINPRLEDKENLNEYREDGKEYTPFISTNKKGALSG